MGLVFYTTFGVPANAAGCARGPLVFIRPEYREDKGLLAHEQTHVKQWFCTLGLHSFLYLLVDRYKLWAEVAAYKVQATYYPDDRRPLFAHFISADYGLSISEADTLKLLNTP